MFDDIKIAFFDLDGTLTNSNGEITQNTINALKILKNKGIKLVITTGRCYKYLLKFKLDLFDYIICNNGACIIDLKSNKPIHEEVLSINHINDINNFCILNNYEIILNSFDKQYTINNKFINDSIYQIIVIVKTKKDVDYLVNYINKINLNVTYISYSYYKQGESDKYTTNINLKSTDKGNSIKILLDYLNIKKENTICFGDNHNDLTMFNSCEIKVAMDNGLDMLKQKANFVTDSNNNDGVANFILKNK